MQDLARIAEPLTRMTPKHYRFEWTGEQQQAFDELKKRFTEQPILCHYDHTLPIELRTDASEMGLGAVLLREGEDGRKRVVAYAS